MPVYQGWEFPAVKREAPAERFVKLIMSPETTGYPHCSVLLSVLFPGMTTTRHIHQDADELMYVVGRGKAYVDGQEFDLEEDSVIFTRRGQEHEVWNTSNAEMLKLFCVFIPPIQSRDLPSQTMLDELRQITEPYLKERGLNALSAK